MWAFSSILRGIITDNFIGLNKAIDCVSVWTITIDLDIWHIGSFLTLCNQLEGLGHSSRSQEDKMVLKWSM